MELFWQSLASVYGAGVGLMFCIGVFTLLDSLSRGWKYIRFCWAWPYFLVVGIVRAVRWLLEDDMPGVTKTRHRDRR